MPCGVQRAAALARLDDHGAAGHRRDGAVADQEPQPGGLAARRPFADHQAVRGDVREQVRVARRVGIIDAAGQDRDGERPGGQRAAVGGGVDAVRAARDDRPASLAEVGGDLAGHVRAVPGGGP